MGGDGSGKGTHLSFFLTIMKEEYDALLFQSNGHSDVIQSEHQ